MREAPALPTCSAPLGVGSLFSGYGGLDLAVEHVVIAQKIRFSEIKPVKQVFSLRWHEAPNLGHLAVHFVGCRLVQAVRHVLFHRIHAVIADVRGQLRADCGLQHLPIRPRLRAVRAGQFTREFRIRPWLTRVAAHAQPRIVDPRPPSCHVVTQRRFPFTDRSSRCHQLSLSGPCSAHDLSFRAAHAAAVTHRFPDKPGQS